MAATFDAKVASRPMAKVARRILRITNVYRTVWGFGWDVGLLRRMGCLEVEVLDSWYSCAAVFGLFASPRVYILPRSTED